MNNQFETIPQYIVKYLLLLWFNPFIPSTRNNINVCVSLQCSLDLMIK